MSSTRVLLPILGCFFALGSSLADGPDRRQFKGLPSLAHGCVVSAQDSGELDPTSLTIFLKSFSDIAAFSKRTRLNDRELALLSQNPNFAVFDVDKNETDRDSVMCWVRGITLLFGVNHLTFWCDDDASPNAYAQAGVVVADDLHPSSPKGNPRAPAPRDGNGEPYDGTVILGRTFALKLLQEDRDEPNSLVAVLAHECAHIRQFKGKTEFSRTKYRELHADYLAGWLVYRVVKDKKLADRTIATFDEASTFAAIYRIGDTEFNSPDHHGTKRERLRAFLAGFDGEWPSIDSAYPNGLEYIKCVEKKDSGAVGNAKR